MLELIRFDRKNLAVSIRLFWVVMKLTLQFLLLTQKYVLKPLVLEALKRF